MPFGCLIEEDVAPACVVFGYRFSAALNNRPTAVDYYRSNVCINCFHENKYLPINFYYKIINSYLVMR